MIQFSLVLGNLGNTRDRFLGEGYKDQPSKKEMIRQAASIPKVQGVELVGTWDITRSTLKEVQSILNDHNLKCVSIIPDLFAQKRWGHGALTAHDPFIRQQAIEEIKKTIDMACELDCSLVNIWNGQDGYDYPFQGHFDFAWNWLIESIQECAIYCPSIKIAIEYKLKEPRTHSYIGRAAEALLIAEKTGCPNVGVTLDVGHALMAYENPAASAVMLHQYRRLFHLHFNDNYRSWDDDMIVGSVHWIEFAELLYWLNRIHYDGWYSLDQYPYREDAIEALMESIYFLSDLYDAMQEYGLDNLDQLIKTNNPTKVTHTMRTMLGLNRSNHQ